MALPCLELFEREARAQAGTTKSKFAVFCYTPDGVNENTFWPTGTTAELPAEPRSVSLRAVQGQAPHPRAADERDDPEGQQRAHLL